MQKFGLSATLASSGRHCKESGGISLKSTVKVIQEKDIATSQELGSGRFGTCFFAHYSHFQACSKVFKCCDRSTLCKEANIISRFSSNHLPYLFGVCFSQRALLTAFHGFKGVSVTLHDVITKKSKVDLADYEIDLRRILCQVRDGIQELHSVYRVLHNDIKSDNIVLAPRPLQLCVYPVIIDFGKACDVGQGKLYHLSRQEREEYRVHHPQIAPDLRDGLCTQCIASDIYSFGRIIQMVASLLKDKSLHNISAQCMVYNHALRPRIADLKQSLQ